MSVSNRKTSGFKLAQIARLASRAIARPEVAGLEYWTALKNLFIHIYPGWDPHPKPTRQVAEPSTGCGLLFDNGLTKQWPFDLGTAPFSDWQQSGRPLQIGEASVTVLWALAQMLEALGM